MEFAGLRAMSLPARCGELRIISNVDRRGELRIVRDFS